MLSGRGKGAARAEKRAEQGGEERVRQAELGRDGARGLGRDSEGFGE